MTIFSGIVVYVLIWWVVIFCALPFGVRSVEKPQDGTMPGAPINAGIKRKVVVTTLIATLIWFIIFLIIQYGGISFHDMAQKMAL